MSENAKDAREPLFVNMPDDNPALLAATTEAREKLPRFKAAFSAGKFRPAAYLVKVPFVDKSDRGLPSLVATSQVVADNPKRPVAHLWLTVTSILDDLIFCSVGEAPKKLGLGKGDSFVVQDEIVKDWMINSQGIAYGAFSLRVLRNRLGEIERRKFDEHTGIQEFKQDMP